MKIRSGFVSNSSSSSFLIYGATIPKSAFGEEGAIYKFEKNYGDWLEWGPGDCDEVYVGKSWHSIKDDQTGKQFKEEVEAFIKQHFGDGHSCCTHSEAWCDG